MLAATSACFNSCASFASWPGEARGDELLLTLYFFPSTITKSPAGAGEHALPVRTLDALDEVTDDRRKSWDGCSMRERTTAAKLWFVPTANTPTTATVNGHHTDPSNATTNQNCPPMALLWLTVVSLLCAPSFTVAAMPVRYLTRRLTARMSASSKLPQVASELQAKLRASSSSTAPASSSSPPSTAELLALGRDTTSFKNSQTLAMKKKYPIHAAAVKEQVAWIKLFLGVSDFQVDVWFCSDAKMMQLNGEWRNKRKSTDILSFPANDFTAPLVFADDPAMAFEKHLGDLVVSPAYVMRQCARDAKDFAEGLLDDDEDAGVSKAMATVFTLDERVPLLLVHGMLHLVGYVRSFFPSIPPLLFLCN